MKLSLYTIVIGHNNSATGTAYNNDRINIVAINAEAAIAKYKKKKGEFIESVIRIDTIDRFD